MKKYFPKMKLRGLTPAVSSPHLAERNPPKQKSIHLPTGVGGLLRRRMKFCFLILLLGLLPFTGFFQPVQAAELDTLRKEQLKKSQELEAAKKAADEKMREAQNLKNEI